MNKEEDFYQLLSPTNERKTIFKTLRRLLCKLEMKKYGRTLNKYIKKQYIIPYTLSNGYFHQGDVVKCFHCKGEKITTRATDTIDFMYVEWDYICDKCGELLGHCSYGSYEYYFNKFRKKNKGERR